MARLIYLTQEQFESIRDIGAGLMEEVVLVAPSMAEKVRSHEAGAEYAAALYDIDPTTWDLRAQVVNRDNHDFMSFMDSEVGSVNRMSREEFWSQVHASASAIADEGDPECPITFAQINELAKGVPIDELFPKEEG